MTIDETLWGIRDSQSNPPRHPQIPDPTEALREGQQLKGTVVNIAPFGLFVQIAPLLDGCLLFENCSGADWVRKLEVGTQIDVAIRQIDHETGRVVLDLADG